MCTMSQSVARLPGRLRSPRALRRTPVDAFEQIAELCRCDRHRAVRRRWPDETAAFQPLGEQAQALAVVPQHLDQSAATAAEHEQMPAMRVALQLLLHHQRQAVEALAHVRMTGRKPDLHTSRDRNHRRRLPFTSALISADTVEASTAPAIRIRPPAANSISITPAFSAEAGNPGSAAITTGLNAAGVGARSQSCWRQRNNWLVWIPAARAISEATAPGSIVAATIRSLSARDHRRRRCTDVITSTWSNPPVREPGRGTLAACCRHCWTDRHGARRILRRLSARIGKAKDIVGKSVIRRSPAPSGSGTPRIFLKHDRQPNRLFCCCEAQGAFTEVLEV